MSHFAQRISSVTKLIDAIKIYSPPLLGVPAWCDGAPVPNALKGFNPMAGWLRDFMVRAALRSFGKCPPSNCVTTRTNGGETADESRSSE